MTQKKKDMPDMDWRPVFVEYVAVRRCRYNPSYQHMLKLPVLRQDFLWERWKKKHPDKFKTVKFNVSAFKQRKAG